MNRAELAQAIVDESHVNKKTVIEVLRAFENVIVGSVAKGEKIVLPGFLSFERAARSARTARNPQTGEAIDVRASVAAKVSIGSSFKRAVAISNAPIGFAPPLHVKPRPEAMAPDSQE